MRTSTCSAASERLIIERPRKGIERPFYTYALHAGSAGVSASLLRMAQQPTACRSQTGHSRASSCPDWSVQRVVSAWLEKGRIGMVTYAASPRSSRLHPASETAPAPELKGKKNGPRVLEHRGR